MTALCKPTGRAMRSLGNNALLLALVAACTPLQATPDAAAPAPKVVETSLAPPLSLCPEQGLRCTGQTEGTGSYPRHALLECRRHQNQPLRSGETAATQAEAVERCIMQVKGSRYCQCPQTATETPPH